MLPPVDIVLLVVAVAPFDAPIPVDIVHATATAPFDIPILVDIIQFIFYIPPIVDIKLAVVMPTVFYALLAAFVSGVIV